MIESSLAMELVDQGVRTGKLKICDDISPIMGYKLVGAIIVKEYSTVGILLDCFMKSWKRLCFVLKRMNLLF